MTSKPDHYLETEHLQRLIDNPQDSDLWGVLGAAYYFRNGTIDDRTGEIFCPAREGEEEEELTTYTSEGLAVTD